MARRTDKKAWDGGRQETGLEKGQQVSGTVQEGLCGAREGHSAEVHGKKAAWKCSEAWNIRVPQP